MARGSLGIRLLNKDVIFSHLASAIFPRTAPVGIAALINSRFSSAIVRSISAKLQLTESYVTRIPIINPLPELLHNLASCCVTLKSKLVAYDLTEQTFDVSCSNSQLTPINSTEAVLHTLEEINEYKSFEGYSIEGDDLIAVLEETGTPAGWHPLIVDYDALPT